MKFIFFLNKHICDNNFLGFPNPSAVPIIPKIFIEIFNF